ncbi:MAG: serine/threonine-protein kinase [Deltaproteobacteria bacterium]|nr:serine/threonine-protein kinase [Deltaproteobacteria bacterium]
MFEREATTLARLNHPNVVGVHDFLEIDGERWLLLEHVDGPTLAAMADTFPGRAMPFAAACAAAADAARALHVVHSATDDDGAPLGLVHRDVSPDNIAMTSTGVVKLLDFGIVKGATSSALTTVGALKGKFPYMSPEQIQAQALDGRSDLFSLGVTLYLLLCGVRPFRGPSDIIVMSAIIEEDPTPPSSASPREDIPPALDDVVLRLLAKNPRDRFPDGAAAADALARIAAAPSFALARLIADSDDDDEPTRQARSLFTVRPPSVDSLASAKTPVRAPGWYSLVASLVDEDLVEVDELSGTMSRVERVDPAANVATLTVNVPRTKPAREVRSVPVNPPPSNPFAVKNSPRGAQVRRGVAIGALSGAALVVVVGVGVASLYTPTLPPPAVSVLVAPKPLVAHSTSPPPPPSPQEVERGEETLIEKVPVAPPVKIEPTTTTTRPVAVVRKAAAPGLLTVLAIPAAEVFVDGRRIGDAPVNDLKLEPGKHRVRLVGDKGEVTREVIIKSGKASSLKVPMP